MSVLLFLCLVVVSVYGATSPGSCVCATPLELNNGAYNVAVGRSYSASSCPMLTNGVCCDQSSEAAISTQLASFSPAPTCQSDLTSLLCTATCFQSTSLFSTFAPVLNSTNQTLYYERTIYLSTATADALWASCSGAAASLNLTTVEALLGLFGGATAESKGIFTPTLTPFAPLNVWVVNGSMGDEITPSTVSTGPNCANDTYVPPAPETTPAPDASSPSPAPDAGVSPAPDAEPSPAPDAEPAPDAGSSPAPEAEPAPDAGSSPAPDAGRACLGVPCP
eukprot:TRINITY_DN11_c0_g1_i5.p2 TRINITY_DN11_c0_g1~~TRINITY_DN11_c0_g1_i5.p2  ORF type:complete len:279 (+),score=44.56 TRINITY_DN11_c0_g1_i5:48-884(+)